MVSVHLSCAEVSDLVYDFLDDELASDETVRVQEHLHQCERCSRRVEFEDLLMKEMRARLSRVPAVPQWAIERLGARLVQLQAHPFQD